MPGWVNRAPVSNYNAVISITPDDTSTDDDGGESGGGGPVEGGEN